MSLFGMQARAFKLVSASTPRLQRASSQAQLSLQLRARCLSHGRSLPGNNVNKSFFTPAILARVLGGLCVITLGSAYAIHRDPIALEAPGHSSKEATSKAGERLISFDEVAKHNTTQSAWILVNGKVIYYHILAFGFLVLTPPRIWVRQGVRVSEVLLYWGEHGD